MRLLKAAILFKKLDMELDRLNSVVLRVFFLGAFLLLGVAVVEKLLNLFGTGLPFLGGVYPQRLLSWATVLLAFVVALLLRQIREALRAST